MKNSGQCTKCRSTDIARREGKVGPHGSGNHIITGITVFSAVMVTRYICLNCGFTEEWIEGENELEKIRNM